jgi:hypothetical protein
MMVATVADHPTITVTPSIALIPVDYVRVTAHIPRSPDSRAFCVTASLGDLLLRRSCEQLEGDSAAVTNQFYWRNFREAGKYTITLVVRYSTGKSYTTSTTLHLKGGHEPDDPTP